MLCHLPWLLKEVVGHRVVQLQDGGDGNWCCRISEGDGVVRRLQVFAQRVTANGNPLLDDQLRLAQAQGIALDGVRKVTDNHLFESVAALIAAVEQFFAELDNQPATVLCDIGCAE